MDCITMITVYVNIMMFKTRTNDLMLWFGELCILSGWKHFSSLILGDLFFMPSVACSMFELAKYIVASLNGSNICNKQLFTVKVKTKIYI